MARVLVVDDHPDSVRMISVVLSSERHDVVAVESAAAALAALRQGAAFDLIIADQNMPGMTGEALLERVASLWPSMARLMVTADVRLRENPARGYAVIHRPFRLAELRAQVVRALGK
jgi:two-component system response regulator GlrR